MLSLSGRAAFGQTETTVESIDGAAPAPAPARRVVLEGQIGSWSPLGTYGLAIEADVTPWLSIAAGSGLDIYDNNIGRAVPQLALMPRLRYPLPWVGTFVSAGAGASRGLQGIYRQDDELSLEHVFAGGVRARLFAGIGFYLNDPSIPPFGASIYYGAALGYALSPNPVVPPEHDLSLGRWYGWQSLALEVTGAILLDRTQSSELGTRYPARRAAIALYGLGPPLVHFAHRRYARAAVSLALRALVPLTLLGLAGPPRSGDDGGVDPTRAAIAGCVLVAAVDDLILAWRPAAAQPVTNAPTP